MWFLSPSGWPTVAISGSLFAQALADRGWQPISDSQVQAAIDAYNAGAPLVPPDVVDEDELAVALAAKADLVSGSVPDTQLPARLAGLVDSPREAHRISVERRPVLVLDQVFPNAYVDHRIVWVDGDSTLYGIGHDNTLRTSADNGVTWTQKLGNSGGFGSWAKFGLFFRTAAGTLLATYHPYDLTAPKIQRSTNGGAAWVDVVAAQANVDYLGPTSIAQDPVTGYLYLSEYVTVSAATKATWRIQRSTDDGATWAVFHTFDRDATTFPTTAVRHGHGVQWDPVSARMFFLCGDSEQAAGIYRVNDAGTDTEPVLLRSQTAADIYPGAVGVMFFPTHIAWGIDQSSDSWLVRIARDQIGQASPVVEKVARLQSTAFYCIRTAADNSEWLMSVSSENGAGGRLDTATHLYRVADNGATADEVMAESVTSGTSLFWAQPVGDPLKTTGDGRFWFASNVKAAVERNVGMDGWQASARLAWGATPAVKPGMFKRPFYEPASQSSGLVTLAAAGVHAFGAIEVPGRVKRLYIIDAGVARLSGTGLPYFELWNANTAARVVQAGTTTAIFDQFRSMRVRRNEDSSPYVYVTDLLTPGHVLHLRLIEVIGTAGCDATGFFTYAWGF